MGDIEMRKCPDCEGTRETAFEFGGVLHGSTCVKCKYVGIRIRLIKCIPVAEKHGLTKGQEHTSVWPPEGWEDDCLVWIMGSAGEPVRIHGHEWEHVRAEQ